MKGKITSYNPQKGFGFMKTENDTNIFFYKSKAIEAGLNEKDLAKNAEFEIEIGQGKKGLEVKAFVRSKLPCEIDDNRKFLSSNTYKKNFYLFLNKPYFVSEHSKMYAMQPNKKCGFSLGVRFQKNERNKFEGLDNFDFSGINCTEITNNQKANVEALFPCSKECKFKPEWRLTLGLGGASVFDTDITLHHIYGVPYIPASSIKGGVRSYIIETVFNNDEEQAILSQCFCDIFGCAKEHEIHRKGQKKVKKLSYYGKNEPKKAERRGKITFFDALPTDSSQIHIRMDIMNVHYSDYYRSEKKDGKYKEGEVKPPADWSNPSIINFLTVKDTTFQFLLASKDKSLEDLKIKDKTIYKWLEEALENHGIGAKTAVGYGYMTK